MPVFPKRRFQHGALDPAELTRRVPHEEGALRRSFLSLWNERA